MTFDELHQRAKPSSIRAAFHLLLKRGVWAPQLESECGQIYVGVCIDTASSLGFCAEHAAAAAAMITAGENRVVRMVAVDWDGSVLAPCGRCREFIVQLHPDNFKAEVMVNATTVVALRELLPYN